MRRFAGYPHHVKGVTFVVMPFILYCLGYIPLMERFLWVEAIQKSLSSGGQRFTLAAVQADARGDLRQYAAHDEGWII